MEDFLRRLREVAAFPLDSDKAAVILDAVGCIEAMDGVLRKISETPSEECHTIPDATARYLKLLHARAA